MCCGGIGTSDPPSTIRQDFHIQPTHTISQGRSVADVVWGQPGTCSSNPTGSNCSAPPPPCKAVGLALSDPPCWYHKTSTFTSKPHTYPRDATSVADVVRGPMQHAAEIYRSHCSATTTMCYGGIGTRSPSGTIRQGLHIQTTHHLSQGRNQCRRRGSGPIRHMQLKFYRSIVPPPPPCAAVGLAPDPPSGTIRQGFTSKLPTPHSQGRNQCCRRDSGPIRHMQLKFYRSNCSATTTMCCGIGTSDPPTGTIRQGFHIQLPTLLSRDASVADVVWGQWHMQLILPFHCSATTTMCCGIGTSDPPSGTIRQGFHIQTPPVPGTQPVSQTWFRGPFGTCSSNSTVSHCTTTTTMCCGGIGIRSTLWYHKTRLPHPNYTPIPGTQPVLQTWFNNWHMQLKFYRSNCSPPPPCAAVGLAHFRSTWYHKTRAFTSKLPTPIPGTQPVSQTWFGANSAHAAQIYCSNCPTTTTTMCCGGLALQIHPLVP
jgi:hypothetical protein